MGNLPRNYRRMTGPDLPITVNFVVNHIVPNYFVNFVVHYFDGRTPLVS